MRFFACNTLIINTLRVVMTHYKITTIGCNVLIFNMLRVVPPVTTRNMLIISEL